MARGRTYVPQSGEMTSRELFATLTRRTRSCCRRPLVRYALNTKVGRPAVHARSLQNIFLRCGRIGLGKRSGFRSVCHPWPEMASRIKHFAPSAARRFSFHLLGATQRNRLDSLLL